MSRVQSTLTQQVLLEQRLSPTEEALHKAIAKDSEVGRLAKSFIDARAALNEKLQADSAAARIAANNLTEAFMFNLFEETYPLQITLPVVGETMPKSVLITGLQRVQVDDDAIRGTFELNGDSRNFVFADGVVSLESDCPF